MPVCCARRKGASSPRESAEVHCSGCRLPHGFLARRPCERGRDVPNTPCSKLCSLRRPSASFRFRSRAGRPRGVGDPGVRGRPTTLQGALRALGATSTVTARDRLLGRWERRRKPPMDEHFRDQRQERGASDDAGQPNERPRPHQHRPISPTPKNMSPTNLSVARRPRGPSTPPRSHRGSVAGGRTVRRALSRS
jgi:hypothetical protein